jgi:uncharacterized membrane protein YjgN (DUF898 family)
MENNQVPVANAQPVQQPQVQPVQQPQPQPQPQPKQQKSAGGFLIVDPKQYPVEAPGNYDSNTDSYFDGKIFELWGHIFLRTFMTTLSAGVLAPIGKCLYKRYVINHTVYNGKRLKFEGDPIDLFCQYFKWNFLRVITFGIYSFWIPANYKEWELSHIHFEDEELVKGNSYFNGTVLGYLGINLLFWFITTISFGLLLPVAQIIKLRWELNHSVINLKKVAFKGNSLSFIVRKIGWMLLSAITFGIYGIMIPIKTLRWQVARTGLVKVEEEQQLEEESKKSKGLIFVIVGVIAVIGIIAAIVLFSIFGPSDSATEEEIESVGRKFETELSSGQVMVLDTGGDVDISRIDSSALRDFINDGGSGTIYMSPGDAGGYYTYLTLRKKRTVCNVSIDNYVSTYSTDYNSYDTYTECESYFKHVMDDLS